MISKLLDWLSNFLAHRKGLAAFDRYRAGYLQLYPAISFSLSVTG